MRLTLWILISFCVNVVSASIDCYSELEFSQKYPDPGNADAFICTCEPGRFKAPNQTCVYCPLGTYKSDIGTHECTKCNSEDTLGFIFGSVAHGATSADNCTCQETLIENRRNGSLLCTCPAGKKFGTERRCIACVEGEDGRRRVKVGPGMHECYDCPAFLNYENATSCTWHTSNVCTDPEYFTEESRQSGHFKKRHRASNRRCDRGVDTSESRTGNIFGLLFHDKALRYYCRCAYLERDSDTESRYTNLHVSQCHWKIDKCH